MRTNATGLAERIIEAGWLTALATLPLFFNVHSYRSFEPDKAVLLRWIALIMLLAWAFKGFQHLMGKRRAGYSVAPSTVRLSGSRAVSLSVAVAVLALFLDHVLATFWSIDPRASLWGSYERLQGLYTTSAYLIVFFSMLALVSTPAQVTRAVSATLLASFAVAVYGLMQLFALDPLAWEQRPGNPVRSTLGNALFAAGFLVMTAPLALNRLVGALQEVCSVERASVKGLLLAGTALWLLCLLIAWVAHPASALIAFAVTPVLCLAAGAARNRSYRSYLRVGLYALLLTAQLACILATERRGPSLALVCGFAGFLLLWTLSTGRWKAHLAVSGLGALVVAALIAINMPGSPVSLAEDTSGVGRILRVQPDKGSGRVRTLIWEGSAELMAADPLRTLIGYGPETFRLAFAPHYQPELGTVERRTATPDRAHNKTFDVIGTTGLIGLLLYCSFMVAVFAAALKGVGVLHSRRDAGSVVAACFLSALGLSLGVYLMDGSLRFFGLAVPFGLLAGIVVYTNARSLRGLKAPGRGRGGSSWPIVVAALCSAIVVHFVEIQTGIETVATQTYFWALAALLVVTSDAYRPDGRETYTARPAAGDAGDRPSDVPAGGELDTKPVPAVCVIVALVMLTLMFDFSAPDADVMGERRLSWLFAFTVAFYGLFVLVEEYAGRARDAGGCLEGAGIYAGVVLAAMLGGYWLFRVEAPLETTYHPALLGYAGALSLAIGLTALSLGARPLELGAVLKPRTLVPGLVCLPVLYFAGKANLDVVQADIWFKQGWLVEHQKGRYDQASEAYTRAIAHAPGRDRYYTLLAKAISEKAAGTAGVPEREQLFSRAERALLEARRLTPRDPDHPANLARLYKAWAAMAREQEVRTNRLHLALSYYRRAVELSPSRPGLWNEWGETYSLLGRGALALEKYRRARLLDPTFHETFLHLGDQYAKQGNAERALLAYEQAVAVRPTSVEARLALARFYERLGRLEEAAAEGRRALELRAKKCAAASAPQRPLSPYGLRSEARGCPGAGRGDAAGQRGTTNGDGVAPENAAQ